MSSSLSSTHTGGMPFDPVTSLLGINEPPAKKNSIYEYLCDDIISSQILFVMIYNIIILTWEEVTLKIITKRE